ncbi:tape measure protein [Chryseobacterium turcicum]|uniref:Tape measure protein n=1 Tax=Chryseobacterium turcicum TaxID=2898076 RepID=A0A9Q3YXY3_9FLAO|nr:tape measure protein [Chryseobacterium turcicum]MCD1115605.1 tape measure protein [Chryseobacterium turcicum]
MNTSQGALHFGAGIDLTQWRRDVDSMRRDIVGLTRDTQNETRNMDSAFKNLSIGIASYFSVGAIKSFVMELINVRGEFQKTEIAFTTMLGNAGEAKSLMGEMVELAAKTPFSLQDVSAGAKQLLAFQVPASEVVDTLTRMGNIAAGLSVPLSRINLVYGQVRAKGKLMGDDLRQFTEAGIPMVAELAKKFNKTTGEISAMVSAGKIGFKDVQDVLFSLTNEGGMFFNLMEKQSKSLSGQVANLGDAWDQMLNKIGESQEGLLSDGIQSLIYMVEHYQDVIQIISTLVAAYGTYRAVLITTNYLQKLSISMETVRIWMSLAVSIRTAADAQALFNLTVIRNPYVALAAGIAAVVAALVYLRTANYEAKEEAEKLTLALEYQQSVSDSVAKAYKKNSEQIVGAVEKEIAILKSSYSTLDMRKKAYDNLTKTNKAFVGTIDSEYRATNKLNEAYSVMVSRMKELAIAKGKAALLEELSKKKAQADLDLVLKQDAYEKQYAKNAKLRAENAKKENIGAGMYREYKLEEGVDYSTYNPAKEALKTSAETKKQFDWLVNDVTKGIAESKKKGDQEAFKAWSGIGETLLSDAPMKGTEEWYKGEIDRLEALKAKAVVGSKAWNAYRLQIEKYNDLLSPKKAKTDNKQLAEIIPDGSIKDLERKAQLITDALASVENGIVKLRKVDKYGNDKDKKGNPLLTGENVSVSEAKSRLAKTNQELAAKRKEIQIQTFDEEIAETERQWKIRYQMASHYGEEVAKAMFPKLKGDSYYTDINNLYKDLDGKFKAGVITEGELENWSKLKTILASLNGTKDPFTQFTEDMDKDLVKMKTATEKIDFLNEKLYKLTDQEIASGFKTEIFNQLNEIKQAEQNQYQELLTEHEGYSQRKIQIEKNAADAIKKINSDANLSPEQQKQTAGSVNKKSKEEISQLAVDELTKSQAWMALYGNIDELTAYQMQVLLEQLEAQKGNLANVLTPVDFKILLKNLKETKQQITDENPFLGLLSSVKELFSAFGNESEEAGEKAFSSFERASDGIKGTLKAAKGIISTLAPAREYMSDAANDAIDTIEQVTTMGIMMMQAIDSTVTAVKSALDNASWSNWITAIISIIYTVIRAVVSLFTWIAGNKRKKLEKEIKGLQGTLDSLEETYTNLAIAAEKAFGAMKYDGQKELIKNLQEQQKVLEEMKNTESKKKKADQDKINDYNQQQQDNLRKIQEIKDAIIRDVLQVDVVEMAANIGDALIEAFGKGVEGIDNINKAFDEMIKNIMRNQLNKVLETQMAPIYDNILKAAGFDKDGNGTFNGLTKDEIDDLRAQVLTASTKGKEFIEAYSEIFKDLDMATPEGIKGSIKGMTEKTAGALEAQFNAMRINIVALLQVAKAHNVIAGAQTALLSQIEINTRRLHTIDKTLTEMNSKMKKSLAGVP